MIARRYWLFKTEPESYSLNDLQHDGITYWDGVRNYQARNMLRDDIKPGDGILFYHSNIDSPAIVGTASVLREGYPDPSQFEAGHPKFDPKATSGTPRWFMVDIGFERMFRSPITLDTLRGIGELDGMELLRKGSRLSIQPVTAQEWNLILSLAKQDAGK